jgi:hypothetical protein
MKIFLSWSGKSSKGVAEALREWMPHVINDLDPWVSSEDIYAGDRWVVELARMLEDTTACILCVTPENLTAPWLNFEAGAASKRLEQALVCPYLVGLTARSLLGPLRQFQACEAKEEGTLRLILSLYRQLGSPVISEAQVRRSFKNSALPKNLWVELRTHRISERHDYYSSLV